ncbi:hypothetical protein [Sporosarcina ureae]|uniref:hypothetical protein n=1 Tax=Sporosarcina ureae TaxID=1571 RepID=UPI000A17C3C7|nr:hypothetical protein [Sporosarcina ureae]ARK21362.1 hypothetical protein SporoP32a_07340 [Sporosarcina ureae]
MTTLINSKETLDHINKIINETSTSKDLTEEGKAKKYKEIDNELTRLLKAWNEEFTSSIESQREKLQEEADKLREKVLDRDLSLDEITKLTYQAKVMLSRLAAEGKDGEGFIKILQDFVDAGTDHNRQAFVDNYITFVELTDTFDHEGKDILFSYYVRAKGKLQSPEQKALEAKFTEITQLNSRRPVSLEAAERRVRDMRSVYANQLWQATGDTDVW